MKRSLVLLMLVVLFAAACGTAESDDPEPSANAAPSVTVFRTPS
jgi:hypothetical protein